MSDSVATAALADVSLRLDVALGVAPTALRPVTAEAAFSGPAVPVAHVGSVDVILMAIDDAARGSVLVVDNGGRDDEACVGDLLTLEASTAGLAGIVIWGRHRDTAQLREIGLPVFSLGAHPFGPRFARAPGAPGTPVSIAAAVVRPGDLVVADDDGVVFAPADRSHELVAAALALQQLEGSQAERMRAGETLRTQLDFSAFREAQRTDPTLTLRTHLARIAKAIEV
ncbi:RraA family protein [Herbiconiux sp. A18JL235]|uniref:Putative 4-hydroxy-4-methyl-2-oxoglutarate aldolase n=1 Tax=Herbiconiux sp. A18JL235 TaxID=3152363 RepID=A0AB39BK11_9MICO